MVFVGGNDALNVMGIMPLGAAKGTQVRIEASGEDSDEVLTALRQIFHAVL